MAPLITDAYRAQNRALHEWRGDYGAGGSRWSGEVDRVAFQVNARTILDYGCGKGSLKKALGRKGWHQVFEYDPAMPEKAERHRADLVVCTDVLEHVEPDCLDEVLADIAHLAEKAAFFVVALGPSDKTLPDGRNAHLIQEGSSWWMARIATFWPTVEARRGRGLDRELTVLCSR